MKKKLSWEKSFSDSQKKLDLLAKEALKEFHKGKTKTLNKIAAAFEANPNIGSSWEEVKCNIIALTK